MAALKDRYETATDKGLRQELLDAMAKIADERFRPQFVGALQSSDVVCRQIAVKAFADLNGPDDADKILSPLLGDSEPAVREAACAALGKIGKTRQISLLLQRCDEQSESSATVRRAAKDAAISIMLRLDAPALKKELDRLTELPGQSAVLVDVLESALAQTSGRAADSGMQAALLGPLAAAREAAGQKEAAADLWLRVVTIQPTHPVAIGALARILIEVGKSEKIAAAIQQIAGGQSGALVDLLAGLTRQVRDARPVADPPMEALAETLTRIDTTGWPPPARQALATFVQACNGATAPAPSSSPASAPASAPRGASQARPTGP
jgi:hypothetical protein